MSNFCDRPNRGGHERMEGGLQEFRLDNNNKNMQPTSAPATMNELSPAIEEETEDLWDE